MNYRPRERCEIIADIEKHIRKDAGTISDSDFSSWLIGITYDYEKIKSELKNPQNWLVRKAKSTKHAREIEELFLCKGMNEGIGVGTNPVYVYVFKLMGTD